MESRSARGFAIQEIIPGGQWRTPKSGLKTLPRVVGPKFRVQPKFQKSFENFRKFSIFSCILCALCYLAGSVSKNPVISLAGCSLCGFAISILWPGTVEIAAKKIPDGGGAMYSAVAIFGDIGCSVAPFLTGLVASMTVLGENALRAGMLINIIYPIIFILIIRKLIKK